ncbi:MAG: adenylosuccinate synthase, partial [Planctomycetes bacterium]|nr:adenylosuccinate synthase [Planctomycetota bacterium]
IVGLQWGDEGKGKVLDALAKKVRCVVRYQGGGNAGHTVIVGDEKHVFHHVPTGILYPGVKCVIGNGTVVDVEALTRELSEARERGVDLSGLVLSDRAHVVLPYHRALDEAREQARSKENQIGTTKRGIGPCYADKASRTGIRVADLYDPETFAKRLRCNLDEKNAILCHLFGQAPLPYEELYTRTLEAAEAVREYVGDGGKIARDFLDAGESVLFEGAQGIMLDIDHGTYPFVTSSSASSAGVASGAGVPPSAVGTVLGIAKAYTTRVGAGPFPTELDNEQGERLRQHGHEFGATTGRPRRCGWLDLVQLDYACGLTGAKRLVLTKLDTLGGFGELKVCVAYERKGERVRSLPADVAGWSELRPVYETLPGFPAEGLVGATTKEELPSAALDYVRFVEARLGVTISYVSTGPQRSALVHMDEGVL